MRLERVFTVLIFYWLVSLVHHYPRLAYHYPTPINGSSSHLSGRWPIDQLLFLLDCSVAWIRCSIITVHFFRFRESTGKPRSSGGTAQIVWQVWEWCLLPFGGRSHGAGAQQESATADTADGVLSHLNLSISSSYHVLLNPKKPGSS